MASSELANVGPHYDSFGVCLKEIVHALNFFLGPHFLWKFGLLPQNLASAMVFW